MEEAFQVFLGVISDKSLRADFEERFPPVLYCVSEVHCHSLVHYGKLDLFSFPMREILKPELHLARRWRRRADSP